MLRSSLRFALLVPALALGVALCAPAAQAQAPEASGETAAADSSASLFDTRIARGHKPRRRGVRRPATAVRTAPVRSTPVRPAPEASGESTPGGGTPVVSIPPPQASPQSEPLPAEPSPEAEAVPASPSFFDTRIAWGHKAPVTRTDPLFDTEIALGHKELPEPELAAIDATFGVPGDVFALIQAEVPRVAARYRGTQARQRRYFPAIERALAQRGLPSQLKYVALIESGLDPQAVSHAGARGLWQIMPATAGDFGLDSLEVHNVGRATTAAVLYLDQLHRMFDGDWLLAVAAYNGGPGRVFAAVRDYRRIVGRTPTFWEVRHRLPRETQEYIPRFLAAVRHFDNVEA